MNKILLYGLLTLMMLSAALADFNHSNNIVLNYANITSGNTVVDVSDNGNGTKGAAVTHSDWDYQFPGTAYIDTTRNTFDTTNGAISLWFNADTFNDGGLASDRVTSNYLQILAQTDSKISVRLNDGSTNYDLITANTHSTGTWYHVVITWGSAGMVLYVDATNKDTDAYTGTWTTTNDYYIGTLFSGSNYFDGNISNVLIFNQSLTQTNVTEIYNNGRTHDYFKANASAPSPTTFSYPYEEVDQLVEENPVLVSSTSPVTVVSGTFTEDVGEVTYVSYLGNIQATQTPVGEQYCYLEVNGVFLEGSNVTYSGIDIDTYKSFYKLTNNFTASQVSNTVDMMCYGSSNKQFEVSNVVINIHGLHDSVDYNFSYSANRGNFTVNNLASFDLVFNNTIPATQFNLSDSNKTIYAIFDANYEITYGSDNTAEGYTVVDDYTCPTLKRYGDSGSIGSSSYICIKNITGQNNFTSALYVKGDVDVTYQSYIKQLVLEPYEIKFNTVSDYSLSSTSYVDIDSAIITIDSTDKDLLAIASLSIVANDLNQQNQLRLKIASENGSIIYRDVDSIGETGVVTSMYEFTGLSVQDYNVTLQGLINAVTPNTTIINGSMLYIAVGESDLTPNEFTMTANDITFGTAVQSFTAYNGVTLSTTTGSISYPKQSGLINLTFVSDGYYNVTVFNHNTSNNLQFNVTPYPYLNVTATEFFTNDPIINFTVIDVFGNNYSTTTGILFFQIDQDLYSFDVRNQTLNFTFLSDDHLSDDFQVTLNESINEVNLTVYRLSSFWIYFVEEEDLSPKTGVTFQLRSSVYSGEFSTAATNSYFFNDIPNAEYEIRYSLDDASYIPRSYFLMIPLMQSNDSNITLKVINVTNGANFVRVIVDNDAQPLVGDILEIQRFYPNESVAGEWQAVERALIDSEGDALFAAVPNIISYRFRVLRDFALLDVRAPTFLTDTVQEIRVDDAGDILDTVNEALGISTENITYQRALASFFFDYTSITADFDQICLSANYRYRLENNITTVCSDESSATIIAPAVNTENGSYIVVAYMVRGGEQTTLRVDEFQAKPSSTPDIWDKTAAGLLYFIFVVLCWGIVMEGGVAAGLILLLLGTIVLGVKLLSIIAIPGIAVGGMLVTIGIILYVIQKGQ